MENDKKQENEIPLSGSGQEEGKEPVIDNTGENEEEGEEEDGRIDGKTEDYFKKEEDKTDGMKKHTAIKFRKLTEKYSLQKRENEELKARMNELEEKTKRKKYEEEEDDDDDEGVVDEDRLVEIAEKVVEKREKNKVTTEFLKSKGLVTKADREKRGKEIAKVADQISEMWGVPYEEALEKTFNIRHGGQTKNLGGAVTGGGGMSTDRINAGGGGELSEWVTQGVSDEVIEEWRKRKKRGG